jgi:UDP-N-acetylglucosamine enolpyruvyl transferase|tara:strand:- start:30 stop:275 length:246 start_codon:yes stop_codon:yes gene_type:complete
MAKKSDSSKDEQIGFHKGSLTTLAKEREEMMRILQIVEQLMQMHIKALKDLGVDLQEQAKEVKSSAKQKPAKNKPIEDILK